eukprot:5599108-Amphidinium_carterae.1
MAGHTDGKRSSNLCGPCVNVFSIECSCQSPYLTSLHWYTCHDERGIIALLDTSVTHYCLAQPASSRSANMSLLHVFLAMFARRLWRAQKQTKQIKQLSAKRACSVLA